jgi:serine/threonine protein kinase/DNA-binding SARP family transcriptional activator/ABC-type glycerol-3-phosphate transport system substrate-binding protein
VEYRVLGPFDVRRDGERLALGSFKQRALLALLLIHANEVVSSDRLIDELWGADLVTGHQNALWVHVSKLRSALEPERGQRSEGTLLLTRAPGYVLQVAPDELDVWRFGELVDEGRGLLEVDPAAASIAIAEALALWRGHPYEDFTYEAFAQAEISRLEELRLEAVELRIDADLGRGLASELVAELDGLVRQHAFREGLTARLMVALYRSGRRAEALRAFGRLRSQLREEVGIEPSAALQRLEGQILAADPSVGAPIPALGRQAKLAVRGYELREEIGVGGLGVTYRAYQPAVGREVAIKVIGPELANSPAFVRRFAAEAELVARLEHPHIVPIYDFWREPDAAYIVTRLFRGGSVAEALRDGPMAPPEAAQMVQDVASALALAHRSGIVHRGVEPGSILLDGEGRAYVTDFGIAGDRVADAADAGGRAVAPPGPYISPEQRDRGPLTAASDIFSLAMVLTHALSGRRPDDGGLIGAGLPALVAEVITRATSIDPRDRHPDVSSFAGAVVAALGSAPVGDEPAATVNPYKGLRAFEEGDAADFFGRERLVERLLTRLGGSGTRGRFLAVVGPSGSGKSSVVKAGLLPALRQGALPGSATWFVADMTPGAHPFEAVEAALLRVAVNPPTSLFEQISGGRGGIEQAVRRVLPDDGSQLLLVIDQFEELYTHARPETADSFLEALTTTVEDPSSRLRVVATLRADFYDRPLRQRAVGELFRRGTEVVTPMAPEEIARAVTGPAERMEVRFETGVVAAIVSEVAERTGALPLLQYALTELFDRRRGRTIDLDVYRQAGGASGALVRRAEALYADCDDPTRETTRQVLLRLVTVGEGTDVFRRRIARRELAGFGQPAVEIVVDTLGRHRLLGFDRDPTTREPTVEIAHEALLTEWSRLRAWIEGSRDDVRQHRLLTAGAAEWRAANEDQEYLFRGSRLDQLAAWATTTSLTLSPVERRFLEASVTRRDEEHTAEEERRWREERLRRANRQRTRQLVGAALVLAVVAALAGFAVVQRSKADRLADEVGATDEARRLAIASINAGKDDPELATLLALASLDVSAEAEIPAVPEAEEAMHWAIQARRLPYPATDAPIETRIGPDGPTGIYRLPLNDLVDLARRDLARTFTTDECSEYDVGPCPPAPGDLADPLHSRTRAIPAEPAAPPPQPAAVTPLAGTRITLMGIGYPDNGLRDEIVRFEERTGIDVRLPQVGENDILEAMESGDPPELAASPAPGFIRDLARRGELVDLSTYLDPADGRRAFGGYLTEATSLRSRWYAVPLNLNLKGLIWYPAAEFEAAGYTPPATWGELVTLSQRMVADGRTPWCVGLEDGPWTGWPGTDWIEALVLRLGGVETYDRWALHDIPFDHSTVHAAAEMFGDVVFSNGFVRGGPELANRLHFTEAVFPMLSGPPGCWLYHDGSFLHHELPTGTRLGVDVNYFPLPPVERGGDTPQFGGGYLMAAMADRPEVREFVRQVLRPQWGQAWASHPVSDFLPANVGFDSRQCADPDADARENDTRVRLCREAQDAVAAQRWRFDASDLMPGAVGSIDDERRPGAFYTGMVAYLEQGPGSIRRILADIEDTWASLGRGS